MKKVLIIEDNDEMRAFEKKLLESVGYEVLLSTDAKEGTTLAIEKQPHLIIMDIRLPSKKRGIGAARILRNHEATAHIPIIFVTAYSQGEETKEVQNISNCGYLSKPFDNKELLAIVKRYLEPRQEP